MDQQYYIDLYNILVEKRTNDELEWQDVADLRAKYGISEARDSVRKGSKFFYEFLDGGWEIKPKGEKPIVSTKETLTINNDKSETSERQFYIEDETKLRDENYLLQLHNYDPHRFEIVSAKNSKWNSGENTLYSSKITVKPKQPSILDEDLEQWFNKLDRKYGNLTIPTISSDYGTNGNLLLLPISDLHYALKASMLETGNEYDCNIAENLFFYVIKDVLTRTKHTKLKKIIFTIGGDMSNFDNLAGTTVKGTTQDNACGYFEMMEKLFEMTIMAIDMLANIAPVDVILVNGNHDKTVGYALAQYCYAWYKNDKRVKVDTSPLPRKYVVFGKTLMVFAHDADIKKLPGLIPDEARMYWSDVDMTEVFLQHLHSETVLDEKNHMRIQRLPTISASSAWSNNQGYASHRQCKSFIFDEKYGLTDVLYTNIK